MKGDHKNVYSILAIRHVYISEFRDSIPTGEDGSIDPTTLQYKQEFYDRYFDVNGVQTQLFTRLPSDNPGDEIFNNLDIGPESQKKN